jgi:hypothetical protein
MTSHDSGDLQQCVTIPFTAAKLDVGVPEHDTPPLNRPPMTPPHCLICSFCGLYGPDAGTPSVE